MNQIKTAPKISICCLTKRRYFFEHICTHDWNEAQDAGRPLAEATQLLVNQFPDWEIEIRAYYGQWEHMLGEPVHGTVEILSKALAHPNYRVYALTNWSAETWEIVLKIDRFQFLHWFEGVVVSGQEKTRKPFREIYEILLHRYDLVPQQTLFIDDNLRNVVAAQQLNFQTIHFQSPAQLEQTLHQLGIQL